MKNLYSLAVAQLTVSGAGSEAGVTPVGEEDMEWLKENLLLEQLNAAISALGTEEVRWQDGGRCGPALTRTTMAMAISMPMPMACASYPVGRVLF